MKGFHFITGLFLLFSLSSAVTAADIFKVKNVRQGSSLPLKQSPSQNSNTLVAIPHDASWILRRDTGRKVVKKVVWRKVQWNSHLGWVSAYYLQNDPVASAQAAKRQACLKDRNVKEKICCGYSKEARKIAYKHIAILAVKNIPVGKSLILYSQPSESSKKLVAIPHSATWIADLNERVMKQKTEWRKVQWTGKRGWIKANFVKPDPQTTHIGDLKRKLCVGT